MNILIHSKNIVINELITRYVNRSVKFALDRFSHSIGDVQVSLSDLNGTRGGVDKVCRVRVRMLPRGTVLVEGVKRDVLSAIDATTLRVRNAVSRRVDKRRAKKRRLS